MRVAFLLPAYLLVHGGNVFQELPQTFPYPSLESHFCTTVLCIVLALVVCLSWSTLHELRTVRKLLETRIESEGPDKFNNKEGEE